MEDIPNKKKDQFYFQGKYFDNEEDFWLWTKEWSFLTLDQETAERQLNMLKKDIIMNIGLRGKKFKNDEFREYVEKIFQFSMNELSRLQNETILNQGSENER